MPLHQAFVARGEEHAGIVFTSRRRFPRHSDAMGPLVQALTSFIEEHPEGLGGDIAWL
jgi:hypothetical protein